MENQNIEFTPEEARVLACLMEKAMITPDNYPLTLNSLTLACNQKSSREPVMQLEEGKVGHIVNQLAEQDWAGMDYGGRATRYTQRLTKHLQLDRKQQAVLTVLMLRYPQTLNHIKVRTDRMVDFENQEEIKDVLEDFITRTPALAMHIPKGPGQREDRYTHTLCGEVKIETVTQPTPTKQQTITKHDRLDELERRIEKLERVVSNLIGMEEQD